MKQMERVQKTPKLCDAHADDADVWELTGDAYFAMYQEEWTRKYLDVAWRAYQKMAQKSVVPKPHALMNLAMCYEAYGSYEGAALVLGDLLSLHKDWEGYDDAVFQAGVLLKHLKQYEDASL
jgi:tetratricopeptide (TPR) repeat protein